MTADITPAREETLLVGGGKWLHADPALMRDSSLSEALGRFFRTSFNRRRACPGGGLLQPWFYKNRQRFIEIPKRTLMRRIENRVVLWLHYDNCPTVKRFHKCALREVNMVMLHIKTAAFAKPRVKEIPKNKCFTPLSLILRSAP
jgi:hypothetical protein